MRDKEGPVTLGHYEPEKGEVPMIVTRDDGEAWQWRKDARRTVEHVSRMRK
jgi:hypothetical protein